MEDRENENNQLNGYELSKNWFNWCFENPEKINPNHVALYFFIIEHWNRMGWKDKFGFPMEMAKDAIGIKNYRTYTKTFDDLVEWGFIRVIQKSKNQYSANVIAIVKNTQANTKALSKAMQKHSQKQVRGIVGVDKPNNLTTQEPNNSLSGWRDDFEIYLSEMNQVYEKLKSDSEFIKAQQEFYPNMDIPMSLKKSVDNYWGQKAGWKNKKQSRSENPDWTATFKNSLAQNMNKVYKPKQVNGSKVIDESAYQKPKTW